MKGEVPKRLLVVVEVVSPLLEEINLWLIIRSNPLVLSSWEWAACQLRGAHQLGLV